VKGIQNDRERSKERKKERKKSQEKSKFKEVQTKEGEKKIFSK